jgi:hypothetical protein
MDITHQDINKISSFPSGKAKAINGSKVNRHDRYDLVEQIKSLQRALAHERGKNQRFREEVRTLLRWRL